MENPIDKENRDFMYDAYTEPYIHDKEFGCIFGAFIADACGSYLEFSKKIASNEVMDKCMTMPGGGPHQLDPG